MDRTISLLVIIILVGAALPLTSDATSAEGIGGWEYIASLPENRIRFGLATDGEYMYIAGGATEPVGSDPLNSLWRYDPASDSYTELSPMRYPRTSIDMTLWNNTLWVFTHPNARNWETYSIADDEWALIEPEPWFVFADTECEVVNDTFYFFAHDRVRLLVYHPQNGTLWNLTDLDHRHEDYATGYIDGALFMFGGYNETNHLVVDTAKSFDLDERRWFEWSPMPNPRYRCRGVVVNDLVYVIGGIGSDGNSSGAVEAYCPYNDTWVLFPSMNQPRAYFRAGFLDGSIYSFGGASASRDEYYSSAERFSVPLPDLFPESIDVDMPTAGPIVAGSTVLLAVPVTNGGDWPARDVEVNLLCDGEPLDSRVIPFLDVGGRSVVVFPWTPREGEGTLEASVDVADAIFEHSETDNIFTKKVEVVPSKADLWVNGSSISVEDRVYADGDTVEVGVDVENRGWVPATGIEWRMTVDGDEASNGSFQREIAPGETVRIMTEWQCGQGDREIGFAVECDGEEIGSFPNVGSRVVHIPMRPDLVFEGEPRVEPEIVTEGGELTLTFTVLNSGEVPVSDATVHIMMMGKLYRSVATGALEANGTKDFAIAILAGSPGKTSVTVIIDPGDIVREADEDNNMNLVEFQVIKAASDDGQDRILLYIGGLATALIVIALISVMVLKRKVKKQE